MAKKSTKQKRYLVFLDGTEIFITGETDRYYLCGERQFRKSNQTILCVREEVEKESNNLTEELTTEKEKEA